MQQLDIYQKIIVEKLQDIFSGYKPEVKELYEPIFFALEGGKKIRPACVLLTADIFGGDLQQAVIPAFAVEMFHNFTLLHDDVMDNSPVRRNRPTIQAKWNANQAILSGDAMIILVYQKLFELPLPKIKPIMELINKTALEVCEGQQLDMDFENTLDVPLHKYMTMIKLKTAVLLAASLALGAIVADADNQTVENIYNFGINLGLSFQIQDDYFDTFGDFETFGKKIGNDIVTNKKTYLLINALQLAKNEDLENLKFYFSNSTIDEDQKVREVKQIFENLGIKKITQKEIENYYQKSLTYLDKINSDKCEKISLLYDFAQFILARKK